MVRDIRTMPRGLLAPLSQAALGSLRAVQDGDASSLPEEHRNRLADLALIEATPDGYTVTPLGRERLQSDR